MEMEEFSKRMKDALKDAGPERDSLFAHAESAVLDVDKAWQFGFYQGWLMCLKDVVRSNQDILHGLPKKDPDSPPGDGPLHDDHADSR